MAAIVLEGRDEAGKTTLANQLSNWLQAPVRKSPAGKNNWDPLYGEWTEQYGLVKPLFILDRAPEISEMVYGSLRGQPRMGNSFTRQVAMWRSYPIFMVFCTPPMQAPKAVHKDAEGNHLDFAWLAQAHDGYNLMANMLRLDATFSFRVVKYDYHQVGAFESLKQEISEWRMINEV